MEEDPNRRLSIRNQILCQEDATGAVYLVRLVLVGPLGAQGSLVGLELLECLECRECPQFLHVNP